MVVKFIKIRIDETTLNAFRDKAKAEGISMTALIQSWIDQYLADETSFSEKLHDEKAILKRLEALEKQVEIPSENSSQMDQQTEQDLMQYIQYIDQRIDTLESAVINPLNDEVKGLKKSSNALFNKVRNLEVKMSQIQTNLDNFTKKTQQHLKKIAEYIKN